MTTDTRAVDGVVRYMRSERGKNCICCDGAHVFAYRMEVDPAVVDKRHRATEHGKRTNDLDVVMFVHDAIRSLPDGQRVRITVEAVELDTNRNEPHCWEPRQDGTCEVCDRGEHAVLHEVWNAANPIEAEAHA